MKTYKITAYFDGGEINIIRLMPDEDIEPLVELIKEKGWTQTTQGRIVIFPAHRLSHIAVELLNIA